MFFFVMTPRGADSSVDLAAIQTLTLSAQNFDYSTTICKYNSFLFTSASLTKTQKEEDSVATSIGNFHLTQPLH